MAIFLLMTIPSLVAQSNSTDLDDLRALLITPPTEQERQLLSIDPSFAIKLERDPVYKSFIRTMFNYAETRSASKPPGVTAPRGTFTSPSFHLAHVQGF